MNLLNRWLCCLWIVIAPSVQAEEICNLKSAETIWNSTYVNLHSLFGVTLESPSIVFLQDNFNLQSMGEVATFGYYNKSSKTLHIICNEKTAEWFEVAIRHEATHYYLDQVFGQLPLWLNEGLATYMEEGNLDDEHVNHNINRPRLVEFVDMLKWNKVPPLLDLLRLDPYSKTPSQYYAAYWALIFVLIHDQDKLVQKQRRQLLKDLLNNSEHDPNYINRHLIDSLKKEIPNLADWELRWHREIWDLH